MFKSFLIRAFCVGTLFCASEFAFAVANGEGGGNSPPNPGQGDVPNPAQGDLTIPPVAPGGGNGATRVLPIRFSFESRESCTNILTNGLSGIGATIVRPPEGASNEVFIHQYCHGQFPETGGPHGGGELGTCSFRGVCPTLPPSSTLACAALSEVVPNITVDSCANKCRQSGLNSLVYGDPPNQDNGISGYCYWKPNAPIAHPFHPVEREVSSEPHDGSANGGGHLHGEQLGTSRDLILRSETPRR